MIPYLIFASTEFLNLTSAWSLAAQLEENAMKLSQLLLLLVAIVFATCLGPFAVTAQPAGPGALAPNHNPSFIRGPDIGVTEDSGQYGRLWAENITDNDGGLQTLAFTVQAVNTQLFKTQPAISDNGTLTFEPAQDAYGSTTVYVTLKDGGTDQCIVGNGITNCPGDCVPTDCSSSATRAFTITVMPINDCPKLEIRGDVTVDEDAGSVTQTGWAFNIKHGPVTLTNEAHQTLTFQILNDNENLFQRQPAVSWFAGNPTTASLSFQTKADVFGQAKCTLKVKDNGGTADNGCDTSETFTFTITVRSVNDAPTFSWGENPITVDEDSGPYTKARWAEKISAGPQGEDGQQARFTLQAVSSAVSALFDVQPAIDQQGTLTFTPKDNRNTKTVTAYYYVQLADDDTTPAYSCSPITSCTRLQIVIRPINDAPTFTPGSDISVHEDLLQLSAPPSPAAFTVANWASSISPGNDVEKDSEGQTVTFAVTNDAGGLFSVAPAIDAAGTLSFTLSPHKNGQAKVFVTIKDKGDDNPMDGTSHTFSIVILPVNDAPLFSFSLSSPLSLPQNPGFKEYANFISNGRAGPDAATDETSTQTLSWQATGTPTSLFDGQPSVLATSTGTAKLRFTIKDGQIGEGRINVTLKDNGGTDRSGVDYSTQVFTINVASTNTAPSFTLSTAEVRVNEDQYSSTAFTSDNFLTSILPGQAGAIGTREALTQTTTFAVTVDNAAVFATAPTITSAGRLSFTTASNAFGTATATIIATDDATPPMSSASQSVVIRVLAVNDPPFFTKGDDISVVECRVTSGANCPHSYSAWASGITTSGAGGLANEAAQTLQFSLAPTSGATPTQLANMLSDSLKIDATTGTLSFGVRNGAGNTGGAVTITVTLTDDGGTANGGVDKFVTSFRLTIVAYVPPPSFNFASDAKIIVAEDSGTRTFNNYVVNIAPGQTPASSSGGVTSILRFTVVADNPALFASTPVVVFTADTLASLRITPAANAYGETSLKITIENTETQLSSTLNKVIQITAVNDPPTFVLITTEISVAQGSGAHTVAVASTISAGPSGESSAQSVSFTLTCNAGNNTNATGGAAGFFVVMPTMESSGTVYFSLSASAVGLVYCGVVAKDNGGTADGGIDTSVGIQYFAIRVSSINQAPTFTKGPDVVAYEDDSLVIKSAWATGISDGDEQLVQTVSFTVSCVVIEGSYANNLFSLSPSVAPDSGDLSFLPTPNANGVARCTIYATDDGNSLPPHVSRSASQQFLVRVLSVNDAPTFTVIPGGTSIVIYQGDTRKTVTDWATHLSPGPADESSQTLSFNASVESSSGANLPLFSAAPSVSASGVLSLELRADASGIADVKVCLKDDGAFRTEVSPSSKNYGVNAKCVAIAVTVVAVNQPPVVNLDRTTVQLQEDEGITNVNGTISIAAFANKIASGTSLAEQFEQTTTRVSIACPCFQPGVPTVPRPDVYSALFSKDPTVMIRNLATPPPINPAATQAPVATVGDLIIGLNRDANGYCGGCTLMAWDSAGGNGTSAPFAISVLPVNDAPSFGLSMLPASPSGGSPTTTQAPFTARVDVSDAVADTVDTVSFPNWARDVRAGPPDEQLTQTATFSFIEMDTGRISTLSQYFFQLPTVDANGTLKFKFRAGTRPSTASPFSFTVSVMDNGGTQFGGVDRSDGVIVGQAVTPVRLAIHVAAVSISPSFTIRDEQISVMEDSLQFRAPGWSTVNQGVGVGATLSTSFEIVAATPVLFSQQPAIVYPSGDLIFTPAPNRFGSSVITIRLRMVDRTSGNVTFSGSQFVTVIIIGVNDAPTFALTASPNSNVIDVVSIDEDTAIGDQNSVLIASDISQGPFEVNQTVRFNISLLSTNTIVDMGNLVISPAGRLTRFVPLPNANGDLLVTLHLVDDGGVANGGVDTSVPRQLRIRVNPINDAPTFNLAADRVIVEEGAASLDLVYNTTSGVPFMTNRIGSSITGAGTTASRTIVLRSFISNIILGPADEIASQTISSSVVTCAGSSTSLFATLPSVINTNVRSGAMGADVSFELNPEANGIVVCNVTITDSGSSPIGSTSKAFTLEVTSMNSPPTFIMRSAFMDSAPDTIVQVPQFLTEVSAGSTVEDREQRISAFEVSIVSSTSESLFRVAPVVQLTAPEVRTASLEFTTGLVTGTANLSIVAVDSQGGRSVPRFLFVSVVTALPQRPVTLSAGGIVIQLTLSGAMNSFSRRSFQSRTATFLTAQPDLPSLSAGPLQSNEVMILALWPGRLPAATVAPTGSPSARRQDPASSFTIQFALQSSLAARQAELTDLAEAFASRLISVSFLQALSQALALTIEDSVSDLQAAPTPPPAPPTPADGLRSPAVIALIVVAGVVLVVAVVIGVCCLVRSRANDKKKNEKKQRHRRYPTYRSPDRDSISDEEAEYHSRRNPAAKSFDEQSFDEIAEPYGHSTASRSRHSTHYTHSNNKHVSYMESDDDNGYDHGVQDQHERTAPHGQPYFYRGQPTRGTTYSGGHNGSRRRNDGDTTGDLSFSKKRPSYPTEDLEEPDHYDTAAPRSTGRRRAPRDASTIGQNSTRDRTWLSERETGERGVGEADPYFSSSVDYQGLSPPRAVRGTPGRTPATNPVNQLSNGGTHHFDSEESGSDPVNTTGRYTERTPQSQVARRR